MFVKVDSLSSKLEVIYVTDFGRFVEQKTFISQPDFEYCSDVRLIYKISRQEKAYLASNSMLYCEYSNRNSELHLASNLK